MREEEFNEHFLHHCYEVFIEGPGYRVERLTLSSYDYTDILRVGRQSLDIVDSRFDLKRGKVATLFGSDVYVNKFLPKGVCEILHGKYSKIKTSHVFLQDGKAHSGAILDCRKWPCRNYLVLHIMES